jgi:hypothetical protein
MEEAISQSFAPTTRQTAEDDDDDNYKDDWSMTLNRYKEQPGLGVRLAEIALSQRLGKAAAAKMLRADRR